MERAPFCSLSILCLNQDTTSLFISDQSLTAFCVDKLLKDLLFLSKDLKDHVNILLSVVANDNTKFTDVFTDYHYGQKNTEVMVTTGSLEAIKDTLHRFFRHDTPQYQDMIVNYKIKFCYFNK